MNPLQQIDLVLFYFKDKSLIGGNWTYQDVWEYAQVKNAGISDLTRLVAILKLLVEDGFINPIISEGEPAGYHISFKGLLFEGYENAQKESSRLAEEAAAQRVRTAEIAEENIKNAKTLNRLTAILVIGTAIAALYYLMEIGKYLCKISSNHQ